MKPSGYAIVAAIYVATALVGYAVTRSLHVENSSIALILGAFAGTSIGERPGCKANRRRGGRPVRLSGRCRWPGDDGHAQIAASANGVLPRACELPGDRLRRMEVVAVCQRHVPRRLVHRHAARSGSQ